MSDILFALWFFVPVATANMSPVVAARIPAFQRLGIPLDGGRTFRGKPILGPNKTWRGLLCGVGVATLTLAVQQAIVARTGWFDSFANQVNYATLPTLILGPLFAIGTLGGDACKSFIKRQLNVVAGRPWPFFDQVGEILGAALITAPFVAFGVAQYLWVIVIWVVVDLGVSMLSYLAGWKERPV